MTLTRLFKGIIIASLLLIAANLAFAGETIAGFEDEDLPVLNEELRQIINNQNNSDITQTRVLLWFVSGDLETGTTTSAKITIPFAGTITKALAVVKTAPTGAALIVDVNLNGTTLWASGKLTVSATATSGNKTTFDTTAVAIDDTLDIDIDQIGSTIVGANLTVQLHITETVGVEI